jgi:UTP--glucose-1-phosphate uridylyltransferase
MVRKAVIPAAGLGTRFLPVTKAQPKEMLPVIDTPVIQYVVQEAIDSGIDDILIISGKGKRAIEDHFDRNFELEAQLENREDDMLYHEIRRISDMANIHFIRQKELKGLGDAVYHARLHTGEEPFAVLLGDTIIDSVIPVTQQLIDVYEQYQQVIIGVEEVPRDKVDRYGIAVVNSISDVMGEVTDLIEKPDIKKSPSRLAIAGRYILTPEVFQAIEKTPRGKGNEIQLTDALRLMMRRGSIYSYIIEGKRYDIGNKLDYLKTIVEYGLKRKEFKKQFSRYLRDTAASLSDGKGKVKNRKRG